MKNFSIVDGNLILNNTTLKLSEVWMARFEALAVEAIMEDLNLTKEGTVEEISAAVKQHNPSLKKTKKRGGSRKEISEKQKLIASLYRKGIKPADIKKVYAEKFGSSPKASEVAVDAWKRSIGLLGSSPELAKYLAQNNYEVKESDLEEVSKRFGFENVKDLQDKVFYLRQLSGVDL